MKKTLLLLLVSIGFFLSTTYAYNGCRLLKNNYLDAIEKGQEVDNKQTLYFNCIDRVENLFELGVSSYEHGDLEGSRDYFESYMKEHGDETDPNFESALNNYLIVIEELMYIYAVKDKRKNVVTNGRILFKYDVETAYTLALEGDAHLDKGELDKAKKRYQEAYDMSTDYEEIAALKDILDAFEDHEIIEEKKDKAVTNDQYGYDQDYLVNLNIPAARTKVTNNKEVIVAIIDDGILINHPDLSSNIYVNNDEKPGDGIDNDQNGFIDDINGYDFLANISTIVPNNTHGTAVAGIIGAITNNYEGIAGIAKNVSLMPVIACDDEGCNEEAIIKSIQYAVDNGADIINLSLSSQWFSYSTKFDDIINYAYEKGVIVVVAGGNGDYWQLEKNGTDTDITKVSPVCNYGNNPKKIIGVGAMNSDGYIARWSNFGECIPFYTYGEGILTTVRNISNDGLHDYDYLDGTSFAAPIIAGVIALGFNQYGHVSPDLVYDALEMSPKYIALHGGEKNWTIDADLYIINLGVLLSQQSSAEANKKAVMPIFKKIKNIISKTPQEKQKGQYLSVIALLENANIPLEKRGMVDSLIKLLLTEV